MKHKRLLSSSFILPVRRGAFEFCLFQILVARLAVAARASLATTTTSKRLRRMRQPRRRQPRRTCPPQVNTAKVNRKLVTHFVVVLFSKNAHCLRFQGPRHLASAARASAAASPLICWFPCHLSLTRCCGRCSYSLQALHSIPTVSEEPQLCTYGCCTLVHCSMLVEPVSHTMSSAA